MRSAERARVDGTRVDTGIKAIDLLAPLELGMLVRVHGQAGTGLMALLAELTSRFGDAVDYPLPSSPGGSGSGNNRTGQPGENWPVAETLTGFEERLAHTG